MTRKRYEKEPEQAHTRHSDFISYDTRLPTDEPIAIYYRQSTEGQIGNVSTTLQTVDMVQYLQSRGWDEDDILMIDMDEGVSGAKKIDERQGMSHLFELITNNKIKAVACQDEDRLFRDVTQIQVNIFIEACKQHQVLVLTPSMVYDFAHPQMGMHHARQFRFKSEMAAEYIEAYIRGRLIKSKEYLLRRGRWAGPPMPTGYMADMRKELPSGEPNINWRKFTPCEPFAEVMREYFNIFIRCGRNILKTVHYIEEHGPYFPNPNEYQPPDGHRVVYRLRPTNGRWYPNRCATLRLMFTNAMYLGHWMFDGQIVIWNNHPPLIEEGIFMTAFNTLSRVTFSGDPNPDYQPLKIQSRPSKDQLRTRERPLCIGLIVSEENGDWRPVGSRWRSEFQYYLYMFASKEPGCKHIWSKMADFIDDVISKLLLDKLSATFDYDEWEKSIEKFINEDEQQTRVQQAQLDQLESVMNNLVNSLATLTNETLIQAAEKQYEAAEAEYKRLEAQLALEVSHQAYIEQVKELTSSYSRVLENWTTMSTDEKRIILRTFVSRIEAVPLPEHGLQLGIYWNDNSYDEIRLPRQSSTVTHWFPDEVEQLLDMINRQESQVAIAQTFPHRNWGMIRNKYYNVTGKRLKISPQPIRYHERYDDYVYRVEQLGKDASQGEKGVRTCVHWKPDEVERLISMIEKDESQIAIAKTFPERTWGNICSKYNRVTGKSLRVEPKPIWSKERYPEYVRRVGELSAEQADSDSCSKMTIPYKERSILSNNISLILITTVHHPSVRFCSR